MPTPEPTSNLSERIAVAREALGLSQKKFAELLGVTSQAVNQWESGKTRPSRDNLFVIARLTKLSLQYYIFGSDQLPAHNPQLSALNREIPLLYLPTNERLGSVCPTFACGPSSFAVVINDESNAPLVPIGTQIIFDPDVRPTPGAFVLATVDGKPFMGVLEQVAQEDGDLTIVRPLNSAWPSGRSDRGDFEILGVRTEMTIPFNQK